ATERTGKSRVIGAHPGPNVRPAKQSNRGAMLARYRSAAGIAVVALETFPPQAINIFRQPQTILREAPLAADTITLPVYVYVSVAGARLLLGGPVDSARVGAAGRTVHGSVAFVETPAPARNVVAILGGSDPK